MYGCLNFEACKKKIKKKELDNIGRGKKNREREKKKKKKKTVLLHMWVGDGLRQCDKRSERHRHWYF